MTEDEARKRVSQMSDEDIRAIVAQLDRLSEGACAVVEASLGRPLTPREKERDMDLFTNLKGIVDPELYLIFRMAKERHDATIRRSSAECQSRKEIAMTDDVGAVLEVASSEELAALYCGLGEYLNEHSHELDETAMDGGVFILRMIEAEAARRPIEPLWRKAKRFAIRNAGEIGKTAAAVAIGAFLGIELSD